MSIWNNIPLTTFLKSKYNIDSDKYIRHFIASLVIITTIYTFRTNIFVAMILLTIGLTIYLMKIENDIQNNSSKRIKILMDRFKKIYNKENKLSGKSQNKNNNNSHKDKQSQS